MTGWGSRLQENLLSIVKGVFEEVHLQLLQQNWKMSTPNQLHLETLGSWASHFHIGKIDEIPYFPYISRCRRPYIKDCGRTTSWHEHLIISSLGCVCWSSFVDCNVSISMVNGLRTPYKDEHGLALSQLGGLFPQSKRSSVTIATCYARTMLNLSLLRVSIGVVLSEQVSTRVGLLPMVRFEGVCEFCGGLATMFPNTTLVEADFFIIGWKKKWLLT
jgi:hypothetical protein